MSSLESFAWISWKVDDLLLHERQMHYESNPLTIIAHRKFSHCTSSETSIARLSFTLVTDAVLIQVCCFIFFTKNRSNETNCRRVLPATFVSLCLLPCAHRYSWRAGSLVRLFHIPFWTLDRVCDVSFSWGMVLGSQLDSANFPFADIFNHSQVATTTKR